MLGFVCERTPSGTLKNSPSWFRAGTHSAISVIVREWLKCLLRAYFYVCAIILMRQSHMLRFDGWQRETLLYPMQRHTSSIPSRDKEKTEGVMVSFSVWYYSLIAWMVLVVSYLISQYVVVFAHRHTPKRLCTFSWVRLLWLPWIFLLIIQQIRKSTHIKLAYSKTTDRSLHISRRT